MLAHLQVLRRFAAKPDGAALDAEGHYCVTMFEGVRLLCFVPRASRSTCRGCR